MRYLLLTSLLLALLAPISVSAATLETETAVQFVGCDVYGNQVKIGSVVSCDAGGDCTNYGNQVYIGSTYTCKSGDCRNYGTRVTIGSSFCGDDTNQACIGDLCVGDGILTPMFHATSMQGPDCIPKPEVRDFASIHFTCDESGAPCGVNQQPICWTYRLICMDVATQGALNAFDHQFDRLPFNWYREDSDCEGQPGWPPNATATSMSFRDCIPYGELGNESIPSLHFYCDPAGGACGINQQPICWTYRLVCMDVAMQAAMNVYDRQAERLPIPETREDSSCEGQPGWPPSDGTTLAAATSAVAMAPSGCTNYGVGTGVWAGQSQCNFTKCNPFGTRLGIGFGFGVEGVYGDGTGAGVTAGTC